MDNQQLAVKLIFDKAGREFKMDTFDDRLIVQKTIYLVQCLGINLGYHFSWYLKGPYSTSLASDGFSIQDEISRGLDESRKWKLDDSLAAKIESIRDWFSESDKKALAKQLEVFASVHFLVEKKGINYNNTSELVKTLSSLGKDFSEEEVTRAVRELRGHGVLN